MEMNSKIKQNNHKMAKNLKNIFLNTIFEATKVAVNHKT